jgi:hypothetical protein
MSGLPGIRKATTFSPAAGGLLSLPLSKMPRGRRADRRCLSSSAHLLIEGAAPFGAPSRLSAKARTPSPQLQAAFPGTWPRRALPASACPSPARISRSGHDAARAGPRSRPGPGVTNPARGRRALLHHRDVSRRRPQPSKAICDVSTHCGANMIIFLSRITSWQWLCSGQR